MEKWDEIYYRRLGQYIERLSDPGCEAPWPDRIDLFSVLCGWEFFRDECESPIEKILAAELFWGSDGYHRIDYIHAHQYGTLDYPKFGTYLWGQGQVGRFRVDFLLTACYLHHRALVAIECDGHDFHERTKEQAARDKSRDRFMAAQGVTVLRFTGSEIFRDSAKCAEEVEEVLSAKLTEFISIEHGRPTGGDGASE